MDRLILAEKLESLPAPLRAEGGSAPHRNRRRAAPDVDRQDTLALNLTRAVQLCVDAAGIVIADSDEAAPQTMGQAFDALARLGAIDDALAKRMKAAVGFRNIAVHSYQTVNWDIVFAISHRGLEDFRDFAKAMGALL